VLQGLGQLNVGLSFVGGVGIVILAVILDRITRGMERGKGGIPNFRSGKKAGGDPAPAKGGTA
jgi:ABC-type proline/glycine betaine transport system permease subunit